MNQHEYKTDLYQALEDNEDMTRKGSLYNGEKLLALQSKLKQKQCNRNIHGYCMCPCWD